MVRWNKSPVAAKRTSLHSQSDPVKHVPSGLLRHTDGTPNLVTAYAVPAIRDAPDCNEPLVQAER